MDFATSTEFPLIGSRDEDFESRLNTPISPSKVNIIISGPDCRHTSQSKPYTYVPECAVVSPDR